VTPTPVKDPFTVGVSLPALGLIDLDPAETKRPEFAEYLSGNKYECSLLLLLHLLLSVCLSVCLSV
jgi:hypothetical protein